MSVWQAFWMAIKSVWSNKTRSALTMLGVIIGVASVIAAVGFAQSCMNTISNLIEGMGSNVVTAMIMDNSNRNTIKVSDLEKFAKNSIYIDTVTPYITKSGVIRGNGKEKYTNILGANETYIEMEGMKIEYGRNLSATDTSESRKVAIIGSAVANKLFDKPEIAVDKTIKVNGTEFKIVGVLESSMGGAEGTNDDMIVIPVNVAQRTLKIKSVTMFMASATSNESIDLASQAVEKFLYGVFKDQDSYVIFTQETMLSMLDDVTAIMMLILGSVATISLVVGGIGIMNIMFVSVTERTREIGIRKAIGAKRSDIMIQFLIEALLLTVIAGGLGILIGVGIIKYVIGAIDGIDPVYSKEWIIASFSISVSIGIIFGLFPASKAAKLNPIEALRNE